MITKLISLELVRMAVKPITDYPRMWHAAMTNQYCYVLGHGGTRLYGSFVIFDGGMRGVT